MTLPGGATEQLGELRPGAERLWSALDRMLERASTEGIVAHRLGPLAAGRLRELGRPVPEILLSQERATTLQRTLARTVLERIRAIAEGPLVLLKGLELAHLYPPNGRPFGDLDLLAPDAPAVQAALERAGFEPEGGAVPGGHHHLQPLHWPGGGVRVEIHTRPNWPSELRQIPPQAIFESSRPSSTGIDGLSAPCPLHHTLILAMHGWQHRPLRVLGDLLDVSVSSAGADPCELERAAAELGIGRLWATTRRTADALFADGPRTLSLRTWARSLETLEPRSPRAVDFETLVSGFWWLPPSRALGLDARLVSRRLRRRGGRRRPLERAAPPRYGHER